MDYLVSYWGAVAEFVNLGLSIQGHLGSSVPVRTTLDRCVFSETEPSVVLVEDFSEAQSAEPWSALIKSRLKAKYLTLILQLKMLHIFIR